MTQTGYSNAIVSAMLGFLKGFANWVLKLFKLAKGTSPLSFLANNWLKLLIILLIVGLGVDLLVWLIRWRPHWVWFHKKRVVIKDDRFFEGEQYVDPDEDEIFSAVSRDTGLRPERNWEDRDFTVRSEASKKHAARRREAERTVEETAEKVDVFKDDSFSVNAKKRHSDRYEDEVFNVSDLTGSQNDGKTPVRRTGSAANRRPSERTRG